MNSELKNQIIVRFKNTESGGGGDLTRRELILLNIAEKVFGGQGPDKSDIDKMEAIDAKYLFADEVTQEEAAFYRANKQAMVEHYEERLNHWRNN